MDKCACIYVDAGLQYETVDLGIVKGANSYFALHCVECNRPFLEGDQYERFVGQIHGEKPEVFRTCFDCISLRNEFFCEGWCFGIILVDIALHVKDCDGEISSECLQRLTPGARETVIEMIDQVFQEIDDDE